MKAERKEEEKWVPIVITLESKEEAQYLWHLLNKSYKDIEKIVTIYDVPFPTNVTKYDEDMAFSMWGSFDKFRKELI